MRRFGLGPLTLPPERVAALPSGLDTLSSKPRRSCRGSEPDGCSRHPATLWVRPVGGWMLFAVGCGHRLTEDDLVVPSIRIVTVGVGRDLAHLVQQFRRDVAGLLEEFHHF